MSIIDLICVAVANYQSSSSSSYRADFVFGVSLQQVRKEGAIPVVVAQTIEVLEAKALKEEGILRLAGSNTEINKLKEAYNNGNSPNCIY